MEFVNRENEILRTLDSLVEEEVDFVVVGGYAVSGLGKHRFSVDCDIVISKESWFVWERLVFFPFFNVFQLVSRKIKVSSMLSI